MTKNIVFPIPISDHAGQLTPAPPSAARGPEGAAARAPPAAAAQLPDKRPRRAELLARLGAGAADSSLVLYKVMAGAAQPDPASAEEVVLLLLRHFALAHLKCSQWRLCLPRLLCLLPTAAQNRH